MTYTLELSELAEADLADAMEWYNRLRPGLGADFILCVEQALDRLVDNPEAFAVVGAHVRRALLRRFPYAILFRVQELRIEIIAVFHARRDPKRWQTRFR